MRNKLIVTNLSKKLEIIWRLFIPVNNAHKANIYNGESTAKHWYLEHVWSSEKTSKAWESDNRNIKKKIYIDINSSLNEFNTVLKDSQCTRSRNF